MKYLFFINILVLVSLLNSCKENSGTNIDIVYQEPNSVKFNDSLTLKEAGHVAFPLDKETPIISNSIQFTDNKDGGYFSDLNFFNSTLYIYNYKSRSLIKRIHIGNGHSIGNPQYLTHYLKNLDSLIVINKWTSTIYLIDSLGNVTSKTSLPLPGPGKYIVGMDAKTSKPMKLTGDTLLIIGHLLDLNPDDQRVVKNLIVYNLRTNDSKRIFSRPKLFNYGTWGGAPYELFGTYVKPLNRLIMGYAAEPYLYETDWNGSIIAKHYLSSKFFKKILPYSAKKFTNANVPVAELEKHDDITPHFNQIIYDPYRKLYYRFVVLPLTEEEYKDPKKRFYHQESIIIINSHFDKVGEVLLPAKRYKTDMNFVASEGLNLALLPELQHNGDSLTFMTLKIEKK